MTPNDPLYARQWYMGLIGDIETVWNEYNGAGVRVGVYDSGVDAQHVEFKGRYDASRHVVIDGLVRSGLPNDKSTEAQSHGTNCAGLISASGNNGTGMIGVAWGTTLTGVNIFDTTAPQYLNASDPSGFFAAVRQMVKFDVTNNSWGSAAKFTSQGNLNDAASFDARLIKEYAYVSATGRGGLGTIISQSAGNEGFEANGTGTNASRYTVTVAAARQDGFASSYSNHGANVLVTAPGSESDGTILTTDRTGTPGSTTNDYNPNFNGTSAAAPIVSGVVALMLQANPNLGWRDVQTILAASATHTGSAIGASVSGETESQTWQINKADTWNGGGMHFSQDYGYGMVDAYNAVRMAEAMKHISPTAQTSANEKSFSTDTLPVFSYVPNGSRLDYSFQVTASMLIEHVALTLSFETDYFHALNIYATSAEGTNVRLYDGLSGEADAAANGLTWTFGLDSLRGELAAGTWTVTFVDRFGFTVDYAYLATVQLTAYGTTPSANDVYRYTDEFGSMVSLQSGRATLNDTDGGIDWIDASAVAASSTVDLRGGKTSTIAGRAIAMGSGLVENVTTGDGNDVIIGNGATNKLVGGRGSDTYYVDGAADLVIERIGGGADTVIASVSYALAAGQAVESLKAANATGTAAINLTGNEFSNSISGTAGANTLDGRGGIDVMAGGAGNDTYGVDNVGDRIFETANQGADTLVSTTSYTLAAGQSVEVMRLAASTAGTALNLNGNELANQIFGNAGANVLDGKAGIDVMTGREGNDTYGVDNAGDRVVETMNQGIDTIIASTSFALAAGQSVEILRLAASTGNRALNLNGNELANHLFGNAGANVLDGKGGVDVMTGGAGNDTYGVDMLSDRVFEAANQGVDTVVSTTSFALATGQSIEFLRLAASTGSAAFNLAGNELANTLFGNDGANTLNGGGGADALRGGLGRDVLTGGAGSDVFVFGATAESGATSALADRITDFTAGDRLNVALIDANLLVAGNGAFVLDIGGAFSAGEIRQTKIGADILLDFNVDQDVAAEMSILMLNHGAFVASDFVL